MTSKPLLSALAVGVALTVGVLLGLLISPRATAAATTGPRWEYRCETKWAVGIWKEVDKLNTLGRDGWHLLPPRYSIGGATTLYADVYCFERPL